MDRGLHPHHVAGHQDGRGRDRKNTARVTVTAQIRTHAQAVGSYSSRSA